MLLLPLAAKGQTNTPGSAHYVFAHYMVCYATYGESLQAYVQEIKEAQAAGIDGFALDVGAWSGPETYYKTRVALIYNAAEQSGTGFKLFFSVDCAYSSDIVDMVSTYGPRTNSFRYQGKVVLSTFTQNTRDWQGTVFNPLNAKGIQVFFIPFFLPNPPTELPGYQGAVSILNTYTNLLDGLFLFGAAGLPSQLAQCNSNYTAAVHTAGKTFMAGVSPHYWGYKQYSVGRRYFEYDGGEGIDMQWKAVIASQPDWVEIVTWNDFNESTYVSPVDDPGQYFGELVTPRRYCHSGFLQLSKRYISWFKSGIAPTNDTDALFYFYRTHLKNAVASDTNDVPVTGFLGDVEDTLYTTAFLTAPANLEISSGSQLATNSLPAGWSNLRTRFSPGPQTLTLRRSGAQPLFLKGPDILSTITNYDFFPASGYAYRPAPPRNVHPVPPTVPVGLTATPGNNSVFLSWQAPPAGAVSYNIKRSTTPGSESLLTNVATTSFTDLAVTNGTPYYYVLSSVATGGTESPSTYEVNATPAYIVPNLKMLSSPPIRWLAAYTNIFFDAAGTIPTISGGNVEYWRDSSGNGLDVSAYHGAIPVVLSSNWLAGQPAVYINRSSQFFSVGNEPTFTSPISFVFIGSYNAGNPYLFDTGTNSVNSLSLSTAVAGTYMFFNYNNGSFIVTPNMNPQLPGICIVAVANGADSRMYTNGVLAASGTLSSNARVAGFQIGINSASDNPSFQGFVAEIAQYTNALTQTDVNTISNYCSVRYGIHN
jgi:glucan endo-1,3-alpha-glucosidase